MARVDADSKAINMSGEDRKNPDKLATRIHNRAMEIFRRDRRKSIGDAGGRSRFQLTSEVVVLARPDEEAIDRIELRLTELTHGMSLRRSPVMA